MLKKFLVLVIATVMLTVASCGTILKNGKGGRSNQLDISIVLLDGIGLLFFLVPGIVAYAVDISNRTIYK